MDDAAVARIREARGKKVIWKSRISLPMKLDANAQQDQFTRRAEFAAMRGNTRGAANSDTTKQTAKDQEKVGQEAKETAGTKQAT